MYFHDFVFHVDLIKSNILIGSLFLRSKRFNKFIIFIYEHKLHSYTMYDTFIQKIKCNKITDIAYPTMVESACVLLINLVFSLSSLIFRSHVAFKNIS